LGFLLLELEGLPIKGPGVKVPEGFKFPGRAYLPDSGEIGSKKPSPIFKKFFTGVPWPRGTDLHEIAGLFFPLGTGFTPLRLENFFGSFAGAKSPKAGLKTPEDRWDVFFFWGLILGAYLNPESSKKHIFSGSI